MALKWFEQLKDASRNRSRNVIILHFNIRDLVFDADNEMFTAKKPSELMDVSDFLLNQLMVNRNWVLRYSASGGFSAYEWKDNRVTPYAESFIPTGVVAIGSKGDTINPVMKDAASTPYELLSASGHSDDPKRPFTWRTPELTWPLLDRIIDRRWIAKREGADQTELLKFAVIIDYLDHLIPAQAHLPIQQSALEYMMRWSYSRTLAEANSRVITLTSELEAIHRDLYGKDSRIEVIEIPWPQREERHAFITYLARHADEFANLAKYSPESISEFANLTSGLTYAEIRDFARNVQPEGDWKEPLRVRRQEMIVRQSGSLLKPRYSKFGIDNVAGYDYVKDLLRPRLESLRDGNADVSGILFTGPPGTGKSFFASCLARDVGIEMVTMQTIRGSYVGESERNFERVLRVATNMHPVIIFIDEIDQSFTTSRNQGGDSGVEQRLFARLLEFMEDRNNLGKVLWLAASNRPDKLDPALLSRFRIRLPFLLPDTAAITAMLETQIPAQAGFQWDTGSWATHKAVIDNLVESKLLGKFSGREIDTMVRNAYVVAREKSLVTASGVVASVLIDAIREANNSSNYKDYVGWSLRALQQVEANNAALIRSIKEIFPDSVKQEIIYSDASGFERLSMRGIDNVLEELDDYLR